MEDFRNALQVQIAQNNDFTSHAAKLEEIRLRYPHSIEMLPFSEPLGECNCVMYAFKFHMESPYTLFGRFYANTNFVQSLIEQGYLININENPKRGSLVIYFKDGKVEHIGIAFSTNRIVSKWGIGHLYEHEPLEVPSSYGSSIQYFSAIDADRAYELLEMFLKTRHG